MKGIKGMSIHSNKKSIYEKLCENGFVCCLLCLLIAIIPRGILISDTLPLRTVSDEIATISGAAYLAGYDWSEVVSHAGYYGQGFYSLFFWVYRLSDNPIVIYHSLLWISVFFQTSIIPIIYYILRRYFNITNNCLIAVIALIGSYLTTTRVDITYNENILVVLCWWIVFLLFKWIHAETLFKRNIYLILIGILMGWGITIHIRILVFIFAMILAAIFYKLYFSSSRIHMMIFLAIPSFVVPSFFVVEKVKNVLWKAGESSQELRNASVKLSTKAELFESTTWKTFFNIIFGQINTITIFSCGLFVIAIISILLYLLKKQEEKQTLEYKQIFLISTTLILAIGGTIFAQSISWMDGAYNGLAREGTDADIYGYKAFTYIRYFGIYVSPLIILGISILAKQLVNVRDCMKVSWILILGLQIYWLLFIQKYISSNIHAREVFIVFSKWERYKEISGSLYLYGVHFIIIFSLLGYLLSRKNKFHIVLICSCFILVYEYMYAGYKQDVTIQKQNYEYIDESYAFFENISVERGNELYYIDVSDATDHNTYYLVQIYLPKYKIVPVTLDFEKEDAIIISNGKNYIDCLKNTHYIYIQLDDMEHVFVLGKDKIKYFKEYLQMTNYNFIEVGNE